MTPTLHLPQPAASALAHGLFSVVSLPGDDPLITGICPWCDGKGWYWRTLVDAVQEVEEPCDPLVCSSGSVPRLVVGERVTIKSAGDYTTCCGEKWDALNAVTDEAPLDSIVGSAVVDAVLPIETADDNTRNATAPPVVVLYGERAVFFSDRAGEGRDLTDQLPWSSHWSAGNVALVVRDAKAKEER